MIQEQENERAKQGRAKTRPRKVRDRMDGGWVRGKNVAQRYGVFRG